MSQASKPSKPSKPSNSNSDYDNTHFGPVIRRSDFGVLAVELNRHAREHQLKGTLFSIDEASNDTNWVLTSNASVYASSDAPSLYTRHDVDLASGVKSKVTLESHAALADLILVNGVEIVSPPMTLWDGMDNMRRVRQLLLSGGDGHDLQYMHNTVTSQHVHFSMGIEFRRPISVLKLSIAWWHFENGFLGICAPWRGRSAYCAPWKSTPTINVARVWAARARLDTVVKVARACTADQGRYLSLNLTNLLDTTSSKHTIECRLLHGSNDANEMCAWVYTLAVFYARACRLSDDEVDDMVAGGGVWADTGATVVTSRANGCAKTAHAVHTLLRFVAVPALTAFWSRRLNLGGGFPLQYPHCAPDEASWCEKIARTLPPATPATPSTSATSATSANAFGASMPGTPRTLRTSRTPRTPYSRGTSRAPAQCVISVEARDRLHAYVAAHGLKTLQGRWASRGSKSGDKMLTQLHAVLPEQCTWADVEGWLGVNPPRNSQRGVCRLSDAAYQHLDAYMKSNKLRVANLRPLWDDDRGTTFTSAPTWPSSGAMGAVTREMSRCTWPTFRQMVADRRPPAASCGLPVDSEAGVKFFKQINAYLMRRKILARSLWSEDGSKFIARLPESMDRWVKHLSNCTFQDFKNWLSLNSDMVDQVKTEQNKFLRQEFGRR
jgi:hypothetical protein